MPEIGRRVIVIGNTSTGKSTLAAELARRLGVRFVELDGLHWEPNWVEAADESRGGVAGATTCNLRESIPLMRIVYGAKPCLQ